MPNYSDDSQQDLCEYLDNRAKKPVSFRKLCDYILTVYVDLLETWEKYMETGDENLFYTEVLGANQFARIVGNRTPDSCTIHDMYERWTIKMAKIFNEKRSEI